MVNISGQTDAFYSLDTEKQKRILSAAFREFAEKGFKRASTAEIAANAQIGKGMLFYYFGSKDELFAFLFDYTLEYARNLYSKALQTDSKDFLERYIRLTEIKRGAMAEGNDAIAFFEAFYREGESDYTEKYFKETQELQHTLFSGLYDGVDYSLFRGDIDGADAALYIKWLVDSYTADVMERYKNGAFNAGDEEAIKAEWVRFDRFIADVRKLFYK